MAIGEASGKFRTHTASTLTLTPSSPLCGLDLEVGASHLRLQSPEFCEVVAVSLVSRFNGFHGSRARDGVGTLNVGM